VKATRVRIEEKCDHDELLMKTKTYYQVDTPMLLSPELPEGGLGQV
jgi:hypothetical protein